MPTRAELRQAFIDERVAAVVEHGEKFDALREAAVRRLHEHMITLQRFGITKLTYVADVEEFGLVVPRDWQ